jgi:hypothetical protein
LHIQEVCKPYFFYYWLIPRARSTGYHAVKEAQQRYLAGDGNQRGDPEMVSAIFIARRKRTTTTSLVFGTGRL